MDGLYTLGTGHDTDTFVDTEAYLQQENIHQCD